MPRYGPAVLRALAAWDDALAGYDPRVWDKFTALIDALRTDRAARAAAVPVLPDESERDPSPHRFWGWL